MPLRSDEHLQMRREQILSAAMRAFALEGFHATSMATVIAEAEVSAGSVYRYFPSKEALIRACVERIFAVADEAMADLIADGEPVPPTVALSRVLDAVMAVGSADRVDLSRLAVSGWAEALRDPDLLTPMRGRYLAMRSDFARILARWRDAGHLPPDADVPAAAQVLFGAVPGFIVQRLLLGDTDQASYARGLAALAGLT